MDKSWTSPQTLMLVCIVHVIVRDADDESKIDWGIVSSKLRFSVSPKERSAWSFTASDCESRYFEALNSSSLSSIASSLEKRESLIKSFAKSLFQASQLREKDISRKIEQTVEMLRAVKALEEDTETLQQFSDGETSNGDSSVGGLEDSEEVSNPQSNFVDQFSACFQVSNAAFGAVSEELADEVFRDDHSLGPSSIEGEVIAQIFVSENTPNPEPVEPITPINIDAINVSPKKLSTIATNMIGNDDDIASGSGGEAQPQIIATKNNTKPDPVQINVDTIDKASQQLSIITREAGKEEDKTSGMSIDGEVVNQISSESNPDPEITIDSDAIRFSTQLSTMVRKAIREAGDEDEVSNKIVSPTAPTLSKLLEMPPRDRNQPLPQINSLMNEAKESDSIPIQAISPNSQDSPTKLLAALGTTSTPVNILHSSPDKANSPRIILPMLSSPLKSMEEMEIANDFVIESGLISSDNGAEFIPIPISNTSTIIIASPAKSSKEGPIADKEDKVTKVDPDIILIKPDAGSRNKQTVIPEVIEIHDDDKEDDDIIIETVIKKNSTPEKSTSKSRDSSPIKPNTNDFTPQKIKEPPQLEDDIEKSPDKHRTRGRKLFSTDTDSSVKKRLTRRSVKISTPSESSGSEISEPPKKERNSKASSRGTNPVEEAATQEKDDTAEEKRVTRARAKTLSPSRSSTKSISFKNVQIKVEIETEAASAEPESGASRATRSKTVVTPSLGAGVAESPVEPETASRATRSRTVVTPSLTPVVAVELPSFVESNNPSSPATLITANIKEEDDEALRKVMITLINRIAQHKHGFMYTKPVLTEEMCLQGYAQKIKRPLDIPTIKKNIEAGTIKTFPQLEKEVLLMFMNLLMLNHVTGISNSKVQAMNREIQNDCLAMFEEIRVTLKLPKLVPDIKDPKQESEDEPEVEAGPTADVKIKDKDPATPTKSTSKKRRNRSISSSGNNEETTETKRRTLRTSTAAATTATTAWHARKKILPDKSPDISALGRSRPE